jgi:hypothetical protein
LGEDGEIMGRIGNRYSAVISAVMAAVFLLVPAMVPAQGETQKPAALKPAAAAPRPTPHEVREFDEARKKARSLTSGEHAVLQQVQLPPVVDYSKYVTFVRNQAGFGGCGSYASIAILDILQEREYPYAPDASFYFNSWVYNTKNINQLEVIKQYGSAPEAIYPTNYDIYPQQPPAPSIAVLNNAQLYKIASYSDVVSNPTVDQLKRMLVRHGPVFAAGDTPDGAEHEHVFTIIGYDDNAQAFTVLNSFGDQWGANGMMKMPYGSVVAQPAYGTTPRVDWVRWVENKASSRLEPFTARIHVDHNIARNNLIIRIGVDGQAPMTQGIDSSKGLTFDFPLPAYAAQHWPPNGTNKWYVEVQDVSGRPASETVATVQEVTLVQRRLGAPPVLYRPSARTFPVGGDSTTRIDVPTNVSQARIKEDCFPFNPNQSIFIERNGRLEFIDTNKESVVMAVFPRNGSADSLKALEIIRGHGFNQKCTVKPGMSYWLVSGQAPGGSQPGEKCEPFDTTTLTVRNVKGDWRIEDGDKPLFRFGKGEAQARRGLAIIRKHGFTNMCRIGDSEPSLKYLRR